MLKKILRGLLLPLCLLCLWQIACSRQLFSPYLLPPPAQVAREAVELLTSGVLLTHLAVSLWLHAVVCFGAAVRNCLWPEPPL